MPHTSPTLRKLQLQLCLGTILLITCLIYLPGLSGNFILDDVVNLNGLSAIKDNPTLQNALLFISEGNAGALGRPLSLTTFALQAQDWPQNAHAFKIANLAIHLANGLLIFWIVWSIVRLTDFSSHKNSIALIATLAWLIHPIQISTVLYIIQRMTELSAMFVLGGIAIYLYARNLYLTNPRKGIIWLYSSVILTLPLAVLSKENGALLPAFILAIEYVFYPNNKDRLVTYWRSVCIYTPLIALIGYLAYKIPRFLVIYGNRDFTLTERLLTEPHVFLDYLTKIFVFAPSSYGLYHDDFPISTGLLSPPQTLIGIAVLIMLIASAVMARRAAPLFSIGVLIFYVAHSLEGSVIPLEIYFEHRNYLALLGVILAVSGLLLHLNKLLTKKTSRNIIKAVVATFIIGMGLSTAIQTPLWGNSDQQALVWASENPNSKRAIANAAATYTRNGDFVKAEELLWQVHKLVPTETTPLLFLMKLKCVAPEAHIADIETTVSIAKNDLANAAVTTAISDIHYLHLKGQCPTLDLPHLYLIVEALLSNDNFHAHHRVLYSIYAQLKAGEKKYLEALNLMQKSIDLGATTRSALAQLDWLHASGQTEAALAYIPEVRKINQRNPKHAALWEERINEWEQFLDNELKQQADARNMLMKDAVPNGSQQPDSE